MRREERIPLDRIGAEYAVYRRVTRVIPLLFGWKLVKEEHDEDYRKRILAAMRATKTGRF